MRFVGEEDESDEGVEVVNGKRKGRINDTV